MSFIRFASNVSRSSTKPWNVSAIRCGFVSSRLASAKASGSEIPAISKANWQARVDLAAVYRAFDLLGYNEGICNHLSVIAPAMNGEGNVMLITPRGLQWREITASRLVGVNDAGEVVEGEGELETSAASIHLGLHREKPDATCAFHMHPPYSTAIGCLKEKAFGMYHQNACRFFEDFAYDQEYSGYALETDEGARLAKLLGSKRVLFMCNHGVLVVGPNAAETLDYLYYLERTCMVQGLAMQMRRDLKEIPEEICKMNKASHDREKSKYFYLHLNSYKRILAKLEPNFAT